MARQPKSMRQIKVILRLKNDLKLTVRDITRSCAVPASTVADHLKRAEAAKIGWPIPEEWTEEEILDRLLGAAEAAPVAPAATVPDWAHVHEGLRRTGVMLRLLWQEYQQIHPIDYGYIRLLSHRSIEPTLAAAAYEDPSFRIRRTSAPAPRSYLSRISRFTTLFDTRPVRTRASASAKARNELRIETKTDRTNPINPTLPMTNTTQLIEAPASVPGGTQYEHLAYVDAYDAVLNGDYAFVAYKETDSNGAWRVRIKSSQTAGGVFEPDMMKSNARSTGAQGKPWFPWGYSFDPSAGDPRHIQFRVHVKNGAPSEIEIFVQLRKFDGTADAPRSVRFAWPAA